MLQISFNSCSKAGLIGCANWLYILNNCFIMVILWLFNYQNLLVMQTFHWLIFIISNFQSILLASLNLSHFQIFQLCLQNCSSTFQIRLGQQTRDISTHNVSVQYNIFTYHKAWNPTKPLDFFFHHHKTLEFCCFILFHYFSHSTQSQPHQVSFSTIFLLSLISKQFSYNFPSTTLQIIYHQK